MAKRTLLIVDDDAAVRASLGKLLKSEGHYVELACDAADAVDALRRNPVDLVLLDLNLGGENGWTVAAEIAEIDASIPVVIITGEHEQEDCAIANGVDALVEKPIHVEKFLSVVNRLLAETGEERLKRRQRGKEYLQYVPRWGVRYFATMANRYAQPLRLACIGNMANEQNNLEEGNVEHHIRN